MAPMRSTLPSASIHKEAFSLKMERYGLDQDLGIVNWIELENEKCCYDEIGGGYEFNKAQRKRERDQEEKC